VLTTHYMDEAQILADRLVILDDGVVAAEGTFEDLLRHHGDATTISFRVPAAAGTDALGAAVDVEVRLDGPRAEFSSVDPQRDLHRILGWADDQQIALDDLTVRRSSLEDLFLSIGAPDDGIGASTGSRDAGSSDAGDQKAATP